MPWHRRRRCCLDGDHGPQMLSCGHGFARLATSSPSCRPLSSGSAAGAAIPPHPPPNPGASLDHPPGPTAPRSCCGTWSSLAPTQAWSFAGIPGRAAWLCAGAGKASLRKRRPGTSAGTRIQPRGDFAGGAAEEDVRQGQSRASPRTPGLPGEKGLLFAGNRDFLRIYK